MEFLKKQILPLPSNQRRNPISLCCHIIFPVCLLETERCAVIPGNSESLVLVSNSHQISQVVETFNIIEWRITWFAWIPKSVRKWTNINYRIWIAEQQYCYLHLTYYADLNIMENNSANVFCVHIYILMSTSSVVFETKNNRGILKHQTSIVQLKLQLSVIKFWRKSHQTSCIDFVIYTILLFSLLRAFFKIIDTFLNFNFKLSQLNLGLTDSKL